VNFRGEKRSNATHRSTTDRDCRLASKGTTASGAIPGYTVNALMENRHQILLGIGVEIFRSSASETEGCKALLRRASQRYGYQPATLHADKGFFSKGMIEHLLAHEIEPHIAVERGSRQAHRRVRMRARGLGYQLSQRCRKKIEELFGEAKDWHGMRRFRRRSLFRVFEEALLIGWVLNLKRLATLLPPSAEPVRCDPLIPGAAHHAATEKKPPRPRDSNRPQNPDCPSITAFVSNLLAGLAAARRRQS
jgi:hypothetical protein